MIESAYSLAKESEQEEQGAGPLFTRRQAFMSAGVMALATMVASAAAPEAALAETVDYYTTRGNVTVKVPTRITYKVDGLDSSGGATLSSAGNSKIVNLSEDYEVRVKSLRAQAASGWNLVEDAASSQEPNAVSLTFGPEESTVNLADYIGSSETELPDTLPWSMSAAGGDYDDIVLVADGKVNNVTEDLSTMTKMATARYTLVSSSTIEEIDSAVSDLESALAALDAASKGACHLYADSNMASFVPSQAVAACGVVETADQDDEYSLNWWWSS
ncbi:MAG: hypothetical protein IJ087_02635 [Eggerthellaceae bacterium]|nr:hypothetical protein [Eggerthellaceae bacterium]